MKFKTVLIKPRFAWIAIQKEDDIVFPDNSSDNCSNRILLFHSQRDAKYYIEGCIRNPHNYILVKVRVSITPIERLK